MEWEIAGVIIPQFNSESQIPDRDIYRNSTRKFFTFCRIRNSSRIYKTVKCLCQIIPFSSCTLASQTTDNSILHFQLMAYGQFNCSTFTTINRRKLCGVTRLRSCECPRCNWPCSWKSIVELKSLKARKTCHWKNTPLTQTRYYSPLMSKM